jgi:DNA topoisomerase-6 subunit B
MAAKKKTKKAAKPARTAKKASRKASGKKAGAKSSKKTAKKAAKKTAKKAAKKTAKKAAKKAKKAAKKTAKKATASKTKGKAAQASEASPAAARSSKGGGSRAGSGAAERMAKSQRDISVSEFFTKNRHLLGFDSPRKALLTAVKEAVDNSLDACEEARVLPEVFIGIAAMKREASYTITIEDNGPGIVRAQVPNIFGRLLYGSKFHRLRQSRGQQGIGISAAGMYGQLTTGNAVRVRSKTGKRATAYDFKVTIDTHRNKPVFSSEAAEWPEKDHGTRVEIDLEGEFRRGQRSVTSASLTSCPGRPTKSSPTPMVWSWAFSSRCCIPPRRARSRAFCRRTSAGWARSSPRRLPRRPG